MFQEECRAQILGEHISNILCSGNSEYFNFTFFDLLSDVMIADLNMLDPFLCYRILSVEDHSMAVTINRDVWHGFSEFTNAFTVTQMVKFSHNPSEEHLLKTRHILCYLAGTHKYTLVYDGRSDTGLYAYCDSSYGDDRSDADHRHRSTQGYFFSLANASGKLHSKMQTLISMSSTMAEYIVLSDCAHDCA